MDDLHVKRALRLGSEFDPGQFVFDYFNDAQLRDLAQNLGIDLATSRAITNERNVSNSGKATIKVLEYSREQQRRSTDSEILPGQLPTAILLEILYRLREGVRLWAIEAPTAGSLKTLASGCRAAANERGWIMVQGLWTVSTQPLSMQLTHPDSGERTPSSTVVRVDMPGRFEELTPSGQVRFASGREIRADVFAQTDQWSEESGELVSVAHAVFARMGDPRFSWLGASFGENSDGDF